MQDDTGKNTAEFCFYWCCRESGCTCDIKASGSMDRAEVRRRLLAKEPPKVNLPAIVISALLISVFCSSYVSGRIASRANRERKYLFTKFLFSFFRIVFHNIFSTDCTKSHGNKSFHQNVFSAYGSQTRFTSMVSLHPLTPAKLYFKQFYCNCFLSPYLLYMQNFKPHFSDERDSQIILYQNLLTLTILGLVYFSIKCLTCCTDYSNTLKCLVSCWGHI